MWLLSKDLLCHELLLTVLDLYFIAVTEGEDSECNVIEINPTLLQKRDLPISSILICFCHCLLPILSRIPQINSAFFSFLATGQSCFNKNFIVVTNGHNWFCVYAQCVLQLADQSMQCDHRSRVFGHEEKVTKCIQK